MLENCTLQQAELAVSDAFIACAAGGADGPLANPSFPLSVIFYPITLPKTI